MVMMTMSLLPLLLPMFAFEARRAYAACTLWRARTDRYTLDPSNLGNKFVHLTNSSVQKTTDDIDLGRLCNVVVCVCRRL
jgi:hypothetical protein